MIIAGVIQFNVSATSLFSRLAIDLANNGGEVVIKTNTTGNWTFTLPTDAGTVGYMMTTNGGGVTSWTDPRVMSLPVHNSAPALPAGTLYRTGGGGAGIYATANIVMIV